MAAQQVLLLTGENLTGIAATLLGYYRLDTAREDRWTSTPFGAT